MEISTAPESEFDLEKLFLPAWAQEAPKANRYADFAGEDRADRRFDEGKGARRRPRPDMPRGPRPAGGRFDADKGRRPGQRPQGEETPRREPLPPPTEISVSILPDEKGLDSMARQIRMTGRAYPLFDIAQLILHKPERQGAVRREQERRGAAGSSRCFCARWMIRSGFPKTRPCTHLLGKNFDMFYKAEKTATDPPRGTYTFVAQCGMSGAILGPPNYHDYQNKLRKLHSERFARMPFEAFKARVKIVKDEAVVKKWIEDQSTKTEYICLNVPEPLKLGSREAVEKHFRETHLPNLIKPVEAHTMSGPAGPPIALARPATPVAQRLGGAAPLPLQAGHHLEPAVRRPRPAIFQGQPHRHPCLCGPSALPGHGGHARFRKACGKSWNSSTPTPKCTRRKLIEALAPSAPPPPPPRACPGRQRPRPLPPAAGAVPARSRQPRPRPRRKPGPNKQRWRVICIGSFTKATSSSLPTACLETAKKPLPQTAARLSRNPPAAPAAQSPAAGQQPAQEAESGKQKSEPPVSGEAPVAVESNKRRRKAGSRSTCFQ